ncbi:MAG: hypothetical protein K9G58_14795 [Bacteroidales bacterium]|nr:hypothetical protein [Bacteroidales bacterium]MCF8387774.1 hypothetical protein [Bacteroidales bacterium]MCF8399438.1 hypothetical protein [Bacteroidales bacterium]
MPTRRNLLLLMMIIVASGVSGQIDSLNPGLAKDCLRSLNFSDRMFEEENYDISYKYWQNGYNICDKDIGSGIYFLGEALLEYRLFEVSRGEKKREVLDSLVWLIEERKERYGNEIQLQGQKPLSANKKLNALKVFYGINEKCEYMRFNKESSGSGFSIETFPTLLWEDHYYSIAMAIDEADKKINMNFILDFDEQHDIRKGDIVKLELKDGTQLVLEAKKDASAVGLKKFKHLIFRTKPVYSIHPTEVSMLSNEKNPVVRMIFNTAGGKIEKDLQYPDNMISLVGCLR